MKDAIFYLFALLNVVDTLAAHALPQAVLQDLQQQQQQQMIRFLPC